MRPPSPEIVKGIPVGAESDTSSSIVDSGDEWGQNRSCSIVTLPYSGTKNRPHLGRGARCCAGRKTNKRQDSTWHDIVSRGTEEEDWGKEQGSSLVVELHFKDTPVTEGRGRGLNSRIGDRKV